MIGIIGAMEEEVAEIKAMMTVQQISKQHGYIFYEGLMNQHEVVLLQGGIGKVNAAIATTLLLTCYEIDYVINIGSAGGLHSYQNVGDVVISSQVVHYDVDVTAFQREYGEIPGMPLYFKPDQDLLTRVQNILQTQHHVAHVGLIASGDQFVSKNDQVTMIQKHFPQAMCVEMEAAAIAQVCHVFQKKFIITRSLSDIYNKGENSIQFDEYLRQASLASARMCYALISEL